MPAKIIVPAIAVMLAFVLSMPAAGYSPQNGHSHNDYENETPFRLAYDNRFGSMEVDIWAVQDGLCVAHDEEDIVPERTLDSLYIEPIVELFRRNDGKPWKGGSGSFQLMIDIKSPTEPALSMLIGRLNRFPEVFDRKVNGDAVRVVITGNMPAPSEFGKYPDFVFFDGILGRKYTGKQLKRLALYSGNFKHFSSWNGMGDIPGKERLRLRELIRSAHSVKKRVRFWNAPDSPDAWAGLLELGVDYINTDHVAELAEYLNDR